MVPRVDLGRVLGGIYDPDREPDGEEHDVVRDGKLVGRVKINRTTELASIAIPTKTHAMAPLQRGDKGEAADSSRRP